MSIYATLHVFRMEIGWNNTEQKHEFATVYVQAVPGFIGHPDNGYETDPYVDFLPPLTSGETDDYRAVVIIDEGTEKKGQRYINPLISMTGKEYKEAKFDDLIIEIHHTLLKRINHHE